MVVARTEEVKHARVLEVANGLKNHVVSLLDSHEADVLHRLDEGNRTSVDPPSLLLQGSIPLKSQLLGVVESVVEVVAGPKLHGEAPGN